jgi:AraC-like DNA-binding protein
MTRAEVGTFSEPDEVASAFRGQKVDMTVVGRGSFTADFTSIDLGAMRIQRMSGNLPLIYHATNMERRAAFLFHTKPGPSLFRDGIEVKSDNLVRRLEGPQSHFHRSSVSMDWGSISLRLEEMPSISDAVLGFDLMAPRSEQIITPPAIALATLQRLHATAGLLAARAPEVISNPEGARGLEQILLQALLACVVGKDAREQSQSQRNHQKIMQRFYELLRANPTKALYMLEIATAVGASLRSLTVCCHEHLGIAPKQYLLLRRLHLSRKALLKADASTVTVTDIATQYGFWQFGRFAGQYKATFGEAPSATLRRKSMA